MCEFRKNEDFDMFYEIKQALGQPYFESENCLIYNVDSLQFIPKFPRESINLTITSPPYNIGKAYESIMPVSDYVEWCSRWMTGIHDVVTRNGAFLLNLGYLEVPSKGRAVPISYLLWDKSPFFMQQEIVWHYEAGVASKKYLSPRNEKFIWYVKDRDDYTFNLDPIRDPNVKYPNQKKNGKLRCNPLGKNPGDVWCFPKVTSGENRRSKERTAHPAQFPVSVIEKFILGMSNQGDIVFDPFVGSGSTCIAALKHERKVIGFEISEEYCKIAVERIEGFLNSDQMTFSDLDIKL